jgi:hypothetical protein
MVEIAKVSVNKEAEVKVPYIKVMNGQNGVRKPINKKDMSFFSGHNAFKPTNIRCIAKQELHLHLFIFTPVKVKAITKVTNNN